MEVLVCLLLQESRVYLGASGYPLESLLYQKTDNIILINQLKLCNIFEFTALLIHFLIIFFIQIK